MTGRVRRIWCLATIAVLAVLGLLLLALGDPASHDYPLDVCVAVLLFGTFFGETSIAAIWCALGPFSLARRLAVSSVWLAMIVLAIGINDPIPPYPDIDAILTYGAAVCGQWLLIAGPMWFVATWAGLRFDLDSAQSTNEESRNRQIGIREAMILTAVVAAVLGAASLRSGGLRQISVNWDLVEDLGLITVLIATMTFPCLLGLLISRRSLLSIGGALLFVAAGSALEVALICLAWPPSRGNPDVLLTIVLLAVVQTIWIIVVLQLLRIGGYELRSRRGTRST